MDWISYASDQSSNQPYCHQISQFKQQNCPFSVNFYNSASRMIIKYKYINKCHYVVVSITDNYQLKQIIIQCIIMKYNSPLNAKRQYQKIEIMKLSQKLNFDILRINPITGQLYTNLHFMSSKIMQHKQFHQLLNRLCEQLVLQSQQIIIVVCQSILCQPIKNTTKQHLKLCWSPQNLYPFLQKLKCMIMSASFYKISSDVIRSHKNRSYFKKLYLKQQMKYSFNPIIRKMAAVYQYQTTWLKKQDNLNNIQYFQQFVPLTDIEEVDLSKHLLEIQITSQPLFYQFTGEVYYFNSSQQTMKRAQITYGGNCTQVYVTQCTKQQLQHEYYILCSLKNNYSFLPTFIFETNSPNLRIIKNQFMIPLTQFLLQNSKFISLLTKLKIMAQICKNLSHLHAEGIYYFICPQYVYITKSYKIYFTNITTTYRVVQPIIPVIYPKKNFPYINYQQEDLKNQKCDVYSLGVVLYLILMEVYPFSINKLTKQHFNSSQNQSWASNWTLQTEHFSIQGGQIVKLIGNIVLKCLNLQDINKRPYVEWLSTIFSYTIDYLNK